MYVQYHWIAFHRIVFGEIMSRINCFIYFICLPLFSLPPSPTLELHNPTHPSWVDDIIAAATLSVTPHHTAGLHQPLQKDTEVRRQNPFKPTEQIKKVQSIFNK